MKGLGTQPRRDSPTLHVFEAAATATQPSRVIFSETDKQSAITSQWIAIDEPVEVRQ